MNPQKVSRENLRLLTDLPNIAKAGEEDLHVLGVNKPEDLIRRCPYEMHKELCLITGIKHDPCVIDVFISITRFMSGDDPQVWWAYTAERKAYLKQLNNSEFRVSG